MPKVAKARWLLAAADSQSIANFAKRSRGRIDANQIIPFPTRYNDQYFKIADKKYCRQRLAISEDVHLFVTTGRLNWFKGWQLMIDAFAIFSRQKSKSLFVFIGDGEDEDRIKHYVVEQGLQEQVWLVGKKTQCEIADYLNAADVFLMGSFAEGWSTTLVEACACGVPCVVTDFSSARDMIAEGKNGYVLC